MESLKVVKATVKEIRPETKLSVLNAVVETETAVGIITKWGDTELLNLVKEKLDAGKELLL